MGSIQVGWSGADPALLGVGPRTSSVAVTLRRGQLEVGSGVMNAAQSAHISESPEPRTRRRKTYDQENEL